jgi:hypothetical protein
MAKNSAVWMARATERVEPAFLAGEKSAEIGAAGANARL